ncbi:methyltransferase [Pseudostreptobacillus sp.]
MLHYIESVDKYIKHGNNALNITDDAINLVDFIKNEIKCEDSTGELLDIGSGIGTLTIMLSDIKQFNKFTCVEIQEEVFKLLEENILINKMSDVDIFNKDIKDMIKEEFRYKFRYIVSNPPYLKVDSGKLPENEILKKSKFEVCLNLNELLEIVDYMLMKDGIFFLILPIYRLKEIEKNKKFKIKSMKNILNSKKSFVLLALERK